MIGKNEITIDFREFTKGLSTSPVLPDGGFSPETDQVNLLAVPGVLYAPAQPTDFTSPLNSSIIASAGDANPLGNTKYFLTDSGKYYYWQGSALNLAQTDGTGAYTFGTTDFVQYQLQTFATTATNVVLLTGSNLSSIDPAWWTVTRAHAALQIAQRHPLLVFEKILWIGDKSSLHNWDGTTSSTAVLALSSEQSIVALGVDPGSGKMLISITEGTNYSNSQPHIAKVLFYDGFSPKPVRVVQVDDAINAFYPVGGTLYVTYGRNLGYWNGNGITFLRKLKNVTLSGAELPYKHHITNSGQTLYVADGNQLLAYGDISGGGGKIFYPAFYNQLTTTKFTSIADIGSGQLGLSFAVAGVPKFYTWDTRAVTSNYTTTFHTNRFDFPRPVWIRSAVLEFYDAVSSNATPGALYLYDENQNITAFSSLQNLTGASTYSLRTTQIDVEVFSCKFRYIGDTVLTGLKRIIVYYDGGQ